MNRRINWKLFWYRVGEFLTLLWITFVWLLLMVIGNV